MRKQMLLVLVGYMMTSVAVSAACDTRKIVTRNYTPEVKHTYTRDVSPHIIERIGSANDTGFNATVVIPVTTYRTGVSYQQYDYVSEEVVGQRCADEVVVTSGNDLLRSMFENGISNDERIKLIDENIVGVGKKTAEALLWYFTHEDTPESWEDFTAMVEKAKINEEEKGASHQLITALNNIIVKNEIENKEILGLGSENAIGARTGAVCQNPVVLCRSYSDTAIRTVRLGREEYRTQDIKVQVGVSGVRLLPTEKENFTVTVNPETGVPAVSISSRFGDYQLTNLRETYSNEYIVEIEGQRARVTPNYNSFDVELSLDQNTNEAIITVIDKNFVRNSGKKMISLEVNSLKGFNSVVHSGEYTLSDTNSRTVIRTGTRVAYSTGGLFGKTQSYNVTSSLRVFDSGLFNENRVGLRKTSKVKSSTEK